MKKKITLAALACALVMSMTACQSGSAASAASSALPSPSSQVAASSQAAPVSSRSVSQSAAKVKKFDSMSAFVKSDMFQKQIDTMMKAFKGQSIKLDVAGEGNKLIYSYSYTVELSDLPAEKSTISESLEEQKGIFNLLAKSLKSAVTVEDPVVVVRCLTKGGEEILSKTYDGD